MLAIILVIIPNCLILTGGLNHTGVLRLSDAISIALLVPTGTLRELNVTSPNSTTLKLVQSI
jgi:hypothetical protein